MNSYNKPHLSIPQQAQLLLDKGLICHDRERLERYLSTIGYYRLKVYWLPYLSEDKLFLPNTTFEQILELYIFDRKLRLLVMEAIERIEVALRAYWSNQLALHGGSHAYINPDLFKDIRKHIHELAKIDNEFERSNEAFIKHYKSNYNQPPLPPIWAIAEIMSLGGLSRWFENTKDTSTKKAIALAFGMPTIEVIEGVFHALTYVRNVCAHHGRLWNRKCVIPLPKIKRMRNRLVYAEDTHALDNHLYNYLVVIEALLRAISPNTSWTSRLIMLLNTISNHRAMGFPDDWREREPWKSNAP
jgi:abortive infection bacteriophage resistance protein